MKTRRLFIYQAYVDCNLKRVYFVIDKNGQVLDTCKVIDCGQGAAIAYQHFASKGYLPSSADWTTKIRRQFDEEYAKHRQTPPPCNT